MIYAACRVPAAPVYKEPTHRSEMVNQLLFGEMVKIIEEGARIWVKIKGIMDAYEGWVSRGQLEPVHEIMVFPASSETPMIVQPFTLLKTVDSSMIIPFGSSLLGLHVPADASLADMKEAQGRFGQFRYTYKPESGKKPLKASVSDIQTITRLWLNAPYLWGGRTLTGVDCSGFAQTVFKVMGIRIPRDAWEQALKGMAIGFLQEAKMGDLAFFDDEEGKIIHVGILLNDHEIIHAAGGTGKIQVDKIDNEGIVRSDNGWRTHRLRIIKRYFAYDEAQGGTIVYL